MVNNSTESLHCRRYSVVNKGSYNELVDETARSPYAVGELTVICTTDADGGQVYEFRDSWGRTVLSRVVDTKSTSALKYFDTYYVYDTYGDLCFVIPPRMVPYTASTTSSNMPNLVEKEGYAYIYDPLHRCIGKHVPGSGWNLFIYDDAGRVALYQTENLKDKKQWYSMEYDKQGRLIKKCLLTLSYILTVNNIYSEYVTNNTSSLYCRGIRNAATKTEYVETYEYGKRTTLENPFEAVANIVSAADIVTNPTGLKVAERLPIYGGNPGAVVTRAYYYDRDDRIRQIVEKNHMGGITRKSFKYNYTGQPMVVQTITQPGYNKDFDRITTTYTYDHANRLKSESAVIENSDATIPSSTVRTDYEYDTFGRLLSKQVGDIKETYQYNIRNQETSRSNDYFTMSLAYEAPTQDISVPCYNGNISETTWKHNGMSITGSSYTTNTYSYLYDGLSRLKDVRHSVNNVEEQSYTYRNITYDRNGNIMQLDRYLNPTIPQSWKQQYLYEYDGNRLLQYTSLFIQSGELAMDYNYEYDSSGNTTREGSRTFTYNALNLPETITSPGNNVIKNSYLCDGTKLSSQSTNTSVSLSYLGDNTYIVPVNNASEAPYLESAPFAFGRWIMYTGSRAYAKWYYITDYQGSVRSIVADEGFGEKNVIEVRDYNPFGRPWTNMGMPTSSSRFQYNGKESLQFFGPTYLDYGARLYNPITNRWLSVDPLADKYCPISPYAYCANNPILFVDINGKSISVAQQYREQFIRDLANVFGQNVSLFSFDDSGKLEFNGKTNDLSREQRGVYRGMKEMMKSDIDYNVAYESSYTTSEGKVFDVDKTFGGALFDAATNTITVSPLSKGGEVIRIDFRSEYINQTTTTNLFHEIGEVNQGNKEYRGGAVDYENRVRTILKMPRRPYDVYHQPEPVETNSNTNENR